MNILALNNLKFTPLRNSDNNAQTVSAPKFDLVMAKPLTQDTVSFGHTAKTRMVDVLEHQAEKDMVRLRRIATNYLDNLQAIAAELEPFGVSFCRAYSDKNAVKSPSSQVSKMKRSKSIDLLDKIRGTLFSENIKDLELLNDRILPAFRDRELYLSPAPAKLEDLIPQGYVPTMDEISGKKEVTIPDLDIRLAGVQDQVTKLDSNLKYSISKPQKSGYQDIQMRFIRGYDTKSTPDKIELIILPGKNYAFSKHLESEYIYNPIMKELSELELMKKGYENIPEYNMIKLGMDVIRQILRTEISEKLFKNAEKLDCTDKKDVEQILINEETVQNLNKAFDDLEKLLARYYREAKKSKRIAESTRKRLNNEFKLDKEALAEIRKNTNDAIEFFNEKNYLTRRREFWPELFGEKFQANPN